MSSLLIYWKHSDQQCDQQTRPVTKEPETHFSKAPKRFRPWKAICKNMNHSFYKAVILTCLKDKKCLSFSKGSWLETSLFMRYSVNYHTWNRPTKFGAFEKRTPGWTKVLTGWAVCNAWVQLQLTPENLNFQGKSKKVQVMGSLSYWG